MALEEAEAAPRARLVGRSPDTRSTLTSNCFSRSIIPAPQEENIQTESMSSMNKSDIYWHGLICTAGYAVYFAEYTLLPNYCARNYVALVSPIGSCKQKRHAVDTTVGSNSSCFSWKHTPFISKKRTRMLAYLKHTACSTHLYTAHKGSKEVSGRLQHCIQAFLDCLYSGLCLTLRQLSLHEGKE